MPETVSVKIDGLDDLERKLKDLGPKLAKRGLRKALADAGEVMKEAQIARAPVGPGTGDHPGGNLRETISAVVKASPTNEEGTVVVAPTRHGFYGMFAEFGTSHQPAKPWMTPAFDESKEAAQQKFVDALKDALEEAVKE
jgi:HK97 gp10 family phage protein